MEKLVVSFRESETKYCLVKATDKAIVVKGTATGRSLLKSLLQFEHCRVADEIAACSKGFKSGSAEVIFLLPSAIVKLDCFQTSAAVGQDGWIGKLNKWISSQLAPGNEQSIVSRIAMLRTPSNMVYVSAASIPVGVAQTLESIAIALRLKLGKIEPEIFGLIRKIESRRSFIVENHGEHSYLTAYAPNKGVFTVKIPSPLSSDEWLGTIQNTIGFAASSLFDINDSAFSFYSEDLSVVESLRRENVDLISDHQLQLCNLQIKKAGAGNVYDFLPLILATVPIEESELSYTALPQVNFTREEVQAKIKKEQNEKKVMFFLKILQAAACLTILFNIGMMGYVYMTSSNSMPPQMESKYRDAQNIMASVDKRTQIINEAYRADLELVRIVDSITALRPSQVKLQRIEVNEGGGIKIEAHASAPELGNVYVQQLLQTGSQIVKSAFLERITSTANGSVFTINGQAFH